MILSSHGNFECFIQTLSCLNTLDRHGNFECFIQTLSCLNTLDQTASSEEVCHTNFDSHPLQLEVRDWLHIWHISEISSVSRK